MGGNALCTIDRSGSCRYRFSSARFVTLTYKRRGQASRTQEVYVAEGKEIEALALPRAKPIKEQQCFDVLGDADVSNGFATQRSKTYPFDRRLAGDWCTRLPPNAKTIVTFTFTNKQALRLEGRPGEFPSSLEPKDPLLRLRISAEGAVSPPVLREVPGADLEPERVDGNVYDFRVPGGAGALEVEVRGFVPQPVNASPSLELDPEPTPVTLRRPRLTVEHADGSTVRIRLARPGAWSAPRAEAPAVFTIENGSGCHEVEVAQPDRETKIEEVCIEGDKQWIAPTLGPLDHTVTLKGRCDRAVLLIDGRARGEFEAGARIRLAADVGSPISSGTPHSYQAKCHHAKSEEKEHQLPSDKPMPIVLDTALPNGELPEGVTIDSPSRTPWTALALGGRTERLAWRKKPVGCKAASYPSTSSESFFVGSAGRYYLRLTTAQDLQALLVAPDGSVECIPLPAYEPKVVQRELIAGTHGIFLGHRNEGATEHGYVIEIDANAPPSASIPELVEDAAAPTLDQGTPLAGVVSERALLAPHLQSPGSAGDHGQCEGWGSVTSVARLVLDPSHRAEVTAKASHPSHVHDVVLLARMPSGRWRCHNTKHGDVATLELPSGVEGEVHVWVGSRDPGANDVRYELTLTRTGDSP